MKKLFTLLAFLTCFMGANAKEFVDAEVDFSKYTDISEVPFASWRGSESAFARLSIKDGCLHFESDTPTDPTWDCQFFPIGGVNAEPEVTYTLHFKIKGDHEENVSMLGFGQTPYGQFPITTEWVEGTVDYVATNNDGNILMQCGGYVGTWDIAYLKITHEGKEEAPVNWINIIENGDASAAWGNPDAQVVSNAYDGEGAEEICAYSKEYGYNDNNPHAAFIEDGVFYTTTVPCPDVEDPACQWQNQFWINFPRALKVGEHWKLSFDYKASQNASAPGQGHRAPGDYLGGYGFNSLSFTTEWQTFSAEFDVSTADQHSIAFNLGGNNQYLEEITFYFDNIKLEYMDLEEGLFVAATDTEDGDPEYNFDEAIEFEQLEDYGDGTGFYQAIVGGDDEDAWVNEVMIATKRGNDTGFKTSTIKVSGVIKNDPEVWNSYEGAGRTKTALPVKGKWQIQIDTKEVQINFVKLAGEEDKEELEVIANETEVTLHGSAKTSQNWDNQFWIAANRDLAKGEQVLIEFDYWASEDGILVQSQAHGVGGDGAPCNYIMHGLLGDFTFNTELQHYSQTITIPDNADKMRSICFNMACVDQAVDYTIANVVWMTADKTERLVDPEDEGIFWLKTGEGAYVQYPAEPKPASKAADPNINGDEAINGQDLQALINAIVDESTDIAKFDINGDGEINGQDIQALINIIVKQE